jgi:methionine-gamma-lyase
MDTRKHHRKKEDCNVADLAYSATLTVSLRQIKTLIEHPFPVTHSDLPDEQERGFGMPPEGVKLSNGLEDWHHLIGNLELALEMV